MAALVPVASGVVLWLVTGSLYALCFAALGPLMIGASLVDAARSGRRARREAHAESETAWGRADAQLARLQSEERERRWHRHPDAAAALTAQPLRGPDGPDARTELVIGRGDASSGIRSLGEGERARAFQERCARLDDAPVVVPLGGGVCLRGPEPTTRAAARALVLQLCLRFGASQVAVVGDRAKDWSLDGLPHARVQGRGRFRLGLAAQGDARPEADAVLWAVGDADDVPEGVTTVLEVTEPRRAVLRTPQGVLTLAAECVSAEQAATAATALAATSEQLEVLPDAVALSEFGQRSSPSGLPATIGRSARSDVVVDIVEDGPHAIVTGTTGTGKSELLVSWVTALAAENGPDRVMFVLADFKGGTAFEPLRVLPQVAAVITDLDDAGARRGVLSLTAELRRREAALAAAGARDVRESRLPRLIIVIDEFAALLQEHPDLGAVFTDVAARGRALGMHLIIGTQRAAGVIRDALAANCPLRLSLRVGDAGDSRLVIGTAAASELPGGAGSRGLALVRRPQDSAPAAFRVALTGAADLRAAGVRWAHAAPQPSPWLPALPSLLPLADIPAEERDGCVVIGRADEPDRQRQPIELLRVGVDRGMAVLGAPGSGRTATLRMLRSQRRDALWVPADPEAAWDAVAGLTVQDRVRSPALVLCDDVDALFADLPAEHAQQLALRWEQALRGSRGTTFVLTAARATGPVGRLLDALPRRALLRMPSRVEHIAAGGEAVSFDRERAPGRATIGDRELQFAWVPPAAADEEETRDPREAPWSPRDALTGLVTPAASAAVALLAAAHPQCDVRLLSSDPGDSARPVILVGEAEAWQRQWALWQRVRAEGEVLIRAENPAELRQLAGMRDLPPYARPHAGRAWSLRGTKAPRRVVLPELAP